ncbi:hypothetical protein [Marinobacter salsuginis]|uniref:hypothetical protein n=1 Tax=Marinobacter salsuginis TaxID=418719 RepID=UPI001ADED43D|nr:hypothetical protein [Marinobacter salsuginis]QTN42161.1 hypothetical protein HZ997_01940 [Marinobacter salsuginis]
MNDKYTIALPVFDEWLSSVVAPSGPALGDLALREVSPESRLSERQALEQFARYFKSEMHYDNVQYHANEHDSNCAGFLFTSSALDMCTDEHKSMPTRCMGGCCFRKIKDTWVLCWAWIHPFARKQGLLQKYWKYYFLETFGDFAVEAPLSPSMEAFLKKQQSEHQLVKIGSA